MAVGVNAVWRVRPGGNDANGASFDSSLSGAGTDYSQQDSPAISLTDVACSSTTTITSAAGLFTAAMVGNAIRITGGGATSGYYFIVTYTNSTTVVLDRTPGAVTNGTGKVGGAAATLNRVADSANAVGDKIVGGNTIYIRGAGSDQPSVADYTYSTYFTPVPGDATRGIKYIGENGKPRFDGTGTEDLYIYQGSFSSFENMMFKAAGGALGYMMSLTTAARARNISFFANNQNTSGAYAGGDGAVIEECEFVGNLTTPTLRSGQFGFKSASSIGGVAIRNCLVYRSAGIGVWMTSAYSDHCEGNLILFALEQGIYCSTLNSGRQVFRNTVHGCGGDGIYVPNLSSTMYQLISQNLVTSNGGYGLNLNGGTPAIESTYLIADDNYYYNNTSGARSGINAGPRDVDLSSSPYQNDALTDWTPNRSVAFMRKFPYGSTGSAILPFTQQTQVDIGAIQRPERSGDAPNGWSGGLRPRAFAPGMAR